MSISDHINNSRSATPPKPESIPRGWEPGILYDPNTSIPTQITTPAMEKLEEGFDWRNVIEQIGIDLPDGLELRLTEVKFDPAAWHRDTEFTTHPATGEKLRTPATTRPVYRYKFNVVQTSQFTISEEYLTGLIEQVRGWHIPHRELVPQGTPVAAVLNLADMQLFKPEGGGLEATVERLNRALASFKVNIQQARDRGLNINELVIVNGGDPFEGIAGNYANQLHTVQGGLRAQMNAVLEVWMAFARELYPMFDKRQFVTVLCNHTQFGRQGGSKDSITGESDNGSAFLAETLKRILHSSPDFQDVVFTIPGDEMNVYTEAAGVKLGFNHGHKIPKKDASGFETWLNGIVRSDEAAHAVKVWFTAHRHNFQMFDIGSCSVFQSPSCDGGSKWLTDRTGTHANSGVLSVLVGNHHRLQWTDASFL